MKPIAEIEYQLQADGYDSSIADVVALHQYLTPQRNEGALSPGLILSPHLSARQAEGKHFCEEAGEKRSGDD